MKWYENKYTLYLAGAVILALLGVWSSYAGRLKTTQKELAEARVSLQTATSQVRVEYRTKVVERPVQVAGQVVIQREITTEAVNEESHEDSVVTAVSHQEKASTLTAPKLPPFMAGLGVRVWSKGEAQAMVGMNFGNVSLALSHPLADRLEPSAWAITRF